MNGLLPLFPGYNDQSWSRDRKKGEREVEGENVLEQSSFKVSSKIK